MFDLTLSNLPKLIFDQAQKITQLSRDIDITKRELAALDLQIINKIASDSTLSNDTKRNAAKSQMQQEWTEYQRVSTNLDIEYNQIREAKDTHQYYRDCFDVAKLTYSEE